MYQHRGRKQITLRLDMKIKKIIKDFSISWTGKEYDMR